MKSGWKATSLPRLTSLSPSFLSLPPFFMYHCLVETISRGFSPFSKNFTGWVIGLASPTMSPEACRDLTKISLALKTVFPASSAYRSAPLLAAIASGASWSIRPSKPIMGRVGSFSSRHQMTSVTSPKVQIIAMPEPLSICANRWAKIGTSTPNSGVLALLPNRCAYLSSSG